MDQKRLVLWRDFLRVHRRLLDVLEDELNEAHDLPLAWYDVLVNLDAAGGQSRMSDLADSILLSRSGLTRLVDRMEAARLVQRRRSTDDRRGYNAVLSPAGARMLREAAPAHLAGVERHFTAHINDAEVRTLRRCPRSDPW